MSIQSHSWNIIAREGLPRDTRFPLGTVYPEKVTGLALVSRTSVSLSFAWNAAANATSYRVYVNNETSPRATGITNTNYTLGSLSPNTSYTIRVAGVNAQGEGERSDPETMTTEQAVAPPPEEGLLSPAVFVAPNGSNSNNGSVNSPYATLAYAYSQVNSGTVIYLRGGTYNVTGSSNPTISLNKSGTSSARFRIYAYPGETPILAGTTGNATTGALIGITGNWHHLRGFHVTNASAIGIGITGSSSNNLIERMTVSRCGSRNPTSSRTAAGIRLWGSGSGNHFINCDSYFNRNPGDADADGFQITTTGSGTLLRGCRAWNNIDDGYDTFQSFSGTQGQIIFDNCWAMRNGFAENNTTQGTSTGSGIKFGGTNANADTGNAIIRNCFVYRNRNWGINDGRWDGQARRSFLYNNTVIGPSAQGGPAYRCENRNHVLRNNLVYNDTAHHLCTGDASFNSWQISGLTVNNSSFLQVLGGTDISALTGPRQANGELPVLNFYRPNPNASSGNRITNRGVNVGLPFCGSSPDLGAFEHC